MYLAPGEVHENHTGGRSPLVRLQELGLLGPGFTAIHLGGVDAEELEIAAATGICVVACQQSHLRLGGALCPATRLEALGVPVGIGTDSAVSVGAMDVLAEARLGALLAGMSRGGALDESRRVEHGDDAENGRGDGRASDGGDSHLGVDTASRALRMATLGGATALGMNAHVGTIEVGKFADLICIDLATLASQPAARRPADAIVFGATRDQVTDVWTSGRAAVSDGHLLTFDEQELLALSRRWADRIPTGGAS
jgi:5-methylthioadenosine/S-adenosylhomocysteine deaminase